MKKTVLFLLTVLLILSVLPVSAFGYTVVTDGVSILNPKQNIHGIGYEWDNPNDTLTLTDLNIQTDDDYGLKICDGATVILKGKNYIKAAKAALYIGGNVIFRGSGSLTLYGGEYGVLCNSPDPDKKLSLTDGSYTVRGGTDGFRSEGMTISVSGKSLTVEKCSGNAFTARELLLGSGLSLQAENPVTASYSLLLQGVNASLSSENGPALVCERSLKLESVVLQTGASLSALSSAEEYRGEAAIRTVSTFRDGKKSILFGGSCSIAVDILLCILAVLLLAAAVTVPKLIRKRRADAIIAANAEAEKKAKAERIASRRKKEENA